MGYSKIIYDGKTLIDLTGDTVKADKLLEGYTAHGADGEVINGSCPYDVDSSEATATASEILSGKKAAVKGSIVTGTMKNNGAVSGSISAKDGKYTIPQGFHDGSGKVGIDETEKLKLISENIREGVTILGVSGSMSGTEDAHPQAKTVTPSSASQTIIPDADSGYNYLSEVTVEAIPYAESENPSGGMTVTIG